MAGGEIERLRAENEQLRRIFADASREFEKRNERIFALDGELGVERERSRNLALECEVLRAELRREKARANKFASMLFSLKSEKLKIAEMDLEDTVVVEGDETAVPPDMGKPMSLLTAEKEKRPRGAVPGHTGSGRKIPGCTSTITPPMKSAPCAV